jgi:hypothetical protein
MGVNTNPLNYNSWVQQVGVMAVSQTSQDNTGLWSFVQPEMQTIVPMILNYAELRIQRDLDLLGTQTAKSYALVAGQNVFSLPVDDFLTVQTIQWTQLSGSQVAVSCPLTPVSKEFIQNVYGGLTSAGTPRYFAMYGSNFGLGDDQVTNILIGPAPNFAYTINITGTVREISLFNFAQEPQADNDFTYISSYYPDMLLMASMIYVSAYQRNFSATSDDPNMPMSYEKQYQALRMGAIAEENRKKLQGSAWSAYSTPPSVTPSR